MVVGSNPDWSVKFFVNEIIPVLSGRFVIPSSTNVFCSKMGILQRSVFGYVSGWGERRQRSLQRHQQSCRYFKKVSRTTEVSKKLLYVWLYYKSEVLYTIVLIENFFRIRKNTLYFVSMSTEVHVLR